MSEALVRLEGISKRFGDDPAAVAEVTTTIFSGGITGLAGPDGAGKTTLLRLILGLLAPDAGRILVDGQDIVRLRGAALRRLRERFGVVFQGGALFDSLTVFENVGFLLREKYEMPAAEVAHRVRAQLHDVGLDGVEKKYPDELSGGMRKRVALARALIQDPDFAFFDEPTTGLDPVLLHSILRLIDAAWRRHGFTGVVVSHDIPEIFDIAHHVAVIEGGRLVEEGPPAVVQSSRNPAVRRFLTGGRDNGNGGDHP